MSLPINVDAYAGYCANERPRRFELDDVEYRIYAWEREWRTSDARCFLVRANGKRYVLSCNEQSGEWTLEANWTELNYSRDPISSWNPPKKDTPTNLQTYFSKLLSGDKKGSDDLGEHMFCALSTASTVNHDQACQCSVTKEANKWKLSMGLNDAKKDLKCECQAACLDVKGDRWIGG